MADLQREMDARMRQVLEQYWTLTLPDSGASQIVAQLEPVRARESMIVSVPAHAGRPAAFLKLFADRTDFERERRGLVAGAAAVNAGASSVRAPALLCASDAAQAVLMEQISGATLAGRLRRNPVALAGWYQSAFGALGAWLAAFHAQSCPDANWTDWLARQVEFIETNLQYAAARLGRVRARKAQRLLEHVAGQVQAGPRQMVYCHGDFQSENMLVSGRRIYVIDYAYSGAGTPEQDLVLLHHDLTNTFSDMPLLGRSMARLRESLLQGYGYGLGSPGAQARWDLFELRYQSFPLRHGSDVGDPSSRRRLLRMYRHWRGFARFCQWVDSRAEAYGLAVA